MRSMRSPTSGAAHLHAEQKAASGVPDTATRVAFVYPNSKVVLQTYARDAKFMPTFQTKVWVEVTKALYKDAGLRGVGSISADAQKAAQTRATRMWELYSDLDHTNALECAPRLRSAQRTHPGCQ